MIDRRDDAHCRYSPPRSRQMCSRR
jgi:hypothetical protein